ncbi:probable protein phosphatase 2C T23F11.1 [Amphibalanus amphitrite]|nr:probable protein phosphatase 2C T23F11.1 [Amphibalanus amphitrite]
MLSEPVTHKETHSLGSDAYRVGSSCMQGWRVTMEDAHTHILSLPDDPSAAFFAVFDGHGGEKVAQYASRHLHKVVVRRPEYEKGRVSEALKQACLEIDRMMLADEVLKDDLAGTTAVSVLIRDGTLYCANVGDSRAIASVGGQLEVLSFDHKPNNKTEVERITAAGGWVEGNRVNGNLALSRALGDFIFKRNEEKTPEEQVVTAYPDVETRNITKDWEFIVMACDGIWDVLTNQEVLEFVRTRIGQNMEPEDVCEELMTRCLAPDCQMGGLGCDNMTVVLICLTPGGSYSELVARCAQPLPPGAATAAAGDSDTEEDTNCLL